MLARPRSFLIPLPWQFFFRSEEHWYSNEYWYPLVATTRSPWETTQHSCEWRRMVLFKAVPSHYTVRAKWPIKNPRFPCEIPRVWKFTDSIDNKSASYLKHAERWCRVYWIRSNYSAPCLPTYRQGTVHGSGQGWSNYGAIYHVCVHQSTWRSSKQFDHLMLQLNNWYFQYTAENPSPLSWSSIKVTWSKGHISSRFWKITVNQYHAWFCNATDVIRIIHKAWWFITML